MKIDNKSVERVEFKKILEELKRIKIPFRKKLTAELIQGMLAINRCRIFCLSVCYPKI